MLCPVQKRGQSARLRYIILALKGTQALVAGGPRCVFSVLPLRCFVECVGYLVFLAALDRVISRFL